DVTTTGVDDQTHDAPVPQRGGEQLAEVPAVGRGGGGDHQHVALSALLDRDMDRPVVGRRHADRDRGPADVCARIDGAEPRVQQSRAALRLVDRGDAEATQSPYRIRVGLWVASASPRST